MPELDDIRTFVEVVELGGLSRAATRLGVSKSMVSRRLARLETELGARLLSRNTRGISPTEAGLDYKQRCERSLADIEEAGEAAAQHSGEVAGRLRVAAPLSFGINHVAPLLAEIAARHPRLVVEASYSDRFVDLIADRFDIAVRLGTLRDSTLVARRIAPVRSVAVASPGYLAAKGRPLVPEDLGRHECLVYQRPSERDQWRFQNGRQTVTVYPQGRFRADNGEALLEAAIAGLGIAMLPTFLASRAIQAGAVVPLLTDFPTPEAGLHVVWPPGRHVPGKVRLLIDLMVERFGGERSGIPAPWPSGAEPLSARFRRSTPRRRWSCRWPHGRPAAGRRRTPASPGRP